MTAGTRKISDGKCWCADITDPGQLPCNFCIHRMAVKNMAPKETSYPITVVLPYLPAEDGYRLAEAITKAMRTVERQALERAAKVAEDYDTKGIPDYRITAKVAEAIRMELSKSGDSQT